MRNSHRISRRNPIESNRNLCLKSFRRKLQDNGVRTERWITLGNGRLWSFDAIAHEASGPHYFIVTGRIFAPPVKLDPILEGNIYSLAIISLVLKPQKYSLVYISPECRYDKPHFQSIEITESVELFLRTQLSMLNQRIAQAWHDSSHLSIRMGIHCRLNSLQGACTFIPECLAEQDSKTKMASYPNLSRTTKLALQSPHATEANLVPMTLELTEKEHNILFKVPSISAEGIESFIRGTKRKGKQTTRDILTSKVAFLDFESYEYKFPLTIDSSPGKYLNFQYSLHTLSAWDKPPEHKAFLAIQSDTPNLDFEKSIVSSLQELADEKYVIIVYNKGFELGRLNDLPYFSTSEGEMLLEEIRDHMIIDLYEPFRTNLIYLPDQQGSTKLKDVYRALLGDTKDAPRYSNLKIKNGLQAAHSYQLARLLSKKPHRVAAVESLRHHLLAYCHLDTWSMYLILRRLIQLGVPNDALPNLWLGLQDEYPMHYIECRI